MPHLACNNMEMFYEQIGVGDPVIFLHSGFSRGILAFASQMLDFQSKYTCFFPDFRGHGRTRSNSLEWSTPQHSKDIFAFMDQLQIPKAHIIGYGMGGGVALHCAVAQPHRIASLTSIGQSGFVASMGSEEFEPEWLLQNGRYDFINLMKERHLEAHRGNWQEFLRQKVYDWRKFPQLSNEELRSINCPTLFLAGQYDPFAPEEDLKRVTDLIPNSSYVIVPNCSHRPHMIRENPVFVNDTILQFIDEERLQVSSNRPK
ncbi:alpha/beta fold hydrolase [Paenibacillus radicis (ex Xue et al. 2023)]|uniref:Alpha/beta hydrolase n=1 Tax=Paenibacillus radicis (ex Xue et al. 2023) TaxID=2972489 RepID=A0ABT1YAI8_9BACL|nr:alpha/beta hydrolase [Paenibacillus radicis (ex Xue et al. 2023)]MCR8630202.1 alpha/beta hydrolase [Paenibacillus radicis (ex Xue et al. 2023)]